MGVYTLNGLQNFIDAREESRIYKNRQDWQQEDEILRKKKFCNIDRNHDRGTTEFYKSLTSKTDEYKILAIITYRMFSSSNLIYKNVIPKSDTIEQFYDIFVEMKKYSTKRIPYQFVSFVKGVNYKYFFKNHIYKNKNRLIDKILNFDKISYLDAIDEIDDALGFQKKLKFGIFQGCLDIAYLYPHLIDPDSEPLYGTGSRNALLEILKNEDQYSEIQELIDVAKEFVDNKLSVLEHGLCEYDKYCKFKLGIKKINITSSNYTPHS